MSELLAKPNAVAWLTTVLIYGVMAGGVVVWSLRHKCQQFGYGLQSVKVATNLVADESSTLGCCSAVVPERGR